MFLIIAILIPTLFFLLAYSENQFQSSNLPNEINSLAKGYIKTIHETPPEQTTNLLSKSSRYSNKNNGKNIWKDTVSKIQIDGYRIKSINNSNPEEKVNRILNIIGDNSFNFVYQMIFTIVLTNGSETIEEKLKMELVEEIGQFKIYEFIFYKR